MTKRHDLTRRTQALLLAAVLGLSPLVVAPAQAQMRGLSVGGPNIHVGPRIPINPSVRYSPNLNYGPVIEDRIDSGPRRGHKPPPERASKKSSRNPVAAADRTFVPNEVLIEIAGQPTAAQVQDIAKKHRLRQVQSQHIALLDTTFYRWRIPDGRSVDTVVKQLSADGGIKSVQRNSIFRLQDDQSGKAPFQYALGKLRLPEAQALSTGEKIKVAVIDSGIDVSHPELAGSIAGTFDALDSKEKAHAHGTSIAGIIAAHATLKGASPAAKLLAIRAFGDSKTGAESTTFLVLKGLDYAASNGAQIVNMSFAGPRDAVIARGLAAAAAKNIVLVAAVGNAGPKAAPLFPGADPHVIGVTATDASDAIFAKANQGAYVAVAAPGVDILAPLPDGKYGVSSGTSLSAAYVSGLAALVLARNPSLTPDEVRQALTQSARDLGAPGQDDRFGAGEADAFAAVSAVAAPVATASEPPARAPR
ncbi:MAG: S8 family serine peptidase [Afipia felis]|nr:S8 family serine peptidase [Afipia felis]